MWIEIRVLIKLLWSVSMSKCDLNWENPAYGGAKIVCLDQSFSYIHVHRLLLKFCREREKGFQKMLIMWQKIQALTHTTQNDTSWSEPFLVCSSISRVFPDDVTYVTFILTWLWKSLGIRQGCLKNGFLFFS